MKNSMDAQKLKHLLIPLSRFFIICSSAALVLGLINLLIEPEIKLRQARENFILWRAMARGRDVSEAYLSFPLEMENRTYLESMVHKTASMSQRTMVEKCYQPRFDGNVALKGGLVSEDMIQLSQTLKMIGYRDKEPVRAYHFLRQDGTITGYLLELEGNGHGGVIALLAAYEKDGTISNAKILSHNESPDQGKRIDGENYLRMFFGAQAQSVPVIKSMASAPALDAVSGATISFMGIGNALRAGSLFIMRLGER